MSSRQPGGSQWVRLLSSLEYQEVVRPVVSFYLPLGLLFPAG